MANGTWKRSTTESRRLARRVRYAHVSVLVALNNSPETGMIVPTRTPKGSGSTATRKASKQPSRRDAHRILNGGCGHDWVGAYPGRSAIVEAEARASRNGRKARREELRRLDYFAAKTIEEALQT